jgi:hypothetical protein
MVISEHDIQKLWFSAATKILIIISQITTDHLLSKKNNGLYYLLMFKSFTAPNRKFIEKKLSSARPT